MNAIRINDDSEVSRDASHQIRLPRFIIEEEIGLGDLIKRVTVAAGFNPCGTCEKRVAVLNRWLTLRARSTND